MKIITKTQYLLLAFVTGLLTLNVAMAMQPLSDDEMGQVSGQALLMMDMRPGEGVSNDINFYRAGLDAVVELNANFEKLQLGCGGGNSLTTPGLCDIDIDNLSLSGSEPISGWNEITNPRPNSDAILTRPFFEFAIKNDGSPHREVVGFRLSAEMAEGMLTAGYNDGTINGINSFSGYMKLSAEGVARTQAGIFGKGANEAITGLADINIAACTTGCGNGKGLHSRPGSTEGINIKSMDAPFSVISQEVYGNRLTVASVLAEADVPNIPIGYGDGSLAVRLNQEVCVAWLICLQDAKFEMQGEISGLKADITFNQDLGYIHKLEVKNPFSLSMQSTQLLWPGMVVPAEVGWWMAFMDDINLGQLRPTQEVDISSAYPQFATFLSTWLAVPANRVNISTGDGLQALVNNPIRKNLGLIDLTGNVAAINLPGLPLDSAQDVVPNCFGNARFC